MRMIAPVPVVCVWRCYEPLPSAWHLGRIYPAVHGLRGRMMSGGATRSSRSLRRNEHRRCPVMATAILCRSRCRVARNPLSARCHVPWSTSQRCRGQCGATRPRCQPNLRVSAGAAQQPNSAWIKVDPGQAQAAGRRRTVRRRGRAGRGARPRRRRCAIGSATESACETAWSRRPLIRDAQHAEARCGLTKRATIAGQGQRQPVEYKQGHIRGVAATRRQYASAFTATKG